VLLISADFLASDFIDNNELPALLKAAERAGTVLLPVILGACRLTDSPLADIQAVNSGSTYLYGLDSHKQDEL